MPRGPWLIVLRANGVVERVDGGVPSTWVGRDFTRDANVPRALREAAAALLERDQGAVDVTTTNLEGVEVVLVAARGMPLRPALTRVDDIVARVMDAFASQAATAGVSLTVRTSPRVPSVVCVDREKVVWAISTLVGNALRYVGRDGKESPEVRVELESDESPGAPLRISVRDNGPGIAESKARWLFQRDPKTGRAEGVALLMIADVVAAHRGTIRVGPARDGGTVFTMELPERRRQAS